MASPARKRWCKKAEASIIDGSPKLDTTKSPVARFRKNFSRSKDDSDVHPKTKSARRQIRSQSRDDSEIGVKKDKFWQFRRRVSTGSDRNRRTPRRMNSKSSDSSPRDIQISSLNSFGSDTSDGEAFKSTISDSLANSTHSEKPARKATPPILRRNHSDIDDGPPNHRRTVSFDVASVDNSALMSGRSLEYEFATPTPRDRGERARYSAHHGSRHVKRKFRVRPYRCFPEPVHMTEEEIYTNSIRPSENVEFLESHLAPTSTSVVKTKVDPAVRSMFGSPQSDGRIGSLRVEVLGCISLSRSKPDVAVYLVCGDSAFCTDVVHGYRSPMWPAASKRAAVFPLHHAYARLYVGVFDVKARKNKENDVFCGRVTLDVASLRPNTEYDVNFPLRASSLVYDRHKRGVVRLRFSLHWFSERAAVLSYFKAPKSLVESCPLVEGSPTIPCADPKTFRNVAVTVYGQDLPGKYSRNAFRATMREFSLYEVNLRLLVQNSVLDAILYEKPLVSLYLFVASMYCVVTASVRMIPPFFIGYVLILFADNYQHFITDKAYNLGYKPLTVAELCKALLKDGESAHFEPVAVAKQRKQRKGGSRNANEMHRMNSWHEAERYVESDETEQLDHREFPFSERDTYPKFDVEDALAPSTKNLKAGNARLHGRLSVYYLPPSQDGIEVDADGDDSSRDSDNDNDDESVMTESGIGMGDDVFDLDNIEGEEEDMTMETVMAAGGQMASQSTSSFFDSESNKAGRRIMPGPPQNSDVVGEKIPPQVHLKRMENILQKASLKLSMELVHPPPEGRKTLKLGSEADAQACYEATIVDSIRSEDSASKKRRKLFLDEFDKLLGLQTRTANPVVRIASTFLGPLMRSIRVFVYLIRVLFNVTTWRDPYLSFWVLCFLTLLCLILLVFPWQSFLMLVTLVCLGPQNILVRMHLENKAANKEREEEQASVVGVSNEEELEDANSPRRSGIEHNPPHRSPVTNSAVDASASDSDRRGFFHRVRENRRARRRASDSGGDSETELFQSKAERPAFSSQIRLHGNSAKKLQPRAIAIPYSRLRKERFYDWPPDPTVSRATPIPLFANMYAEDAQISENIPAGRDSPAGTIRYRRGYQYDRENFEQDGTLSETTTGPK